MNAVAVIYVNAHLADLHAEARQRRSSGVLVGRRSLRERLASPAAGLRGSSAPTSGPIVPRLKNYPYGG